MDTALTPSVASMVQLVGSTFVNETDTQKGTVYFQRKGSSLEMMVVFKQPQEKYVLYSGNALQVYQPDLLPEGLRPKARTQVVEVKTQAPPAEPSAQYVALLQPNGGAPAFILTVDAVTKNFTVRKVGAAAEPGKSFELWLISDKLPQPRSLGVIGAADFTARPVLASFDANTVDTATYAVTVEQEGGSPDGQPHSAPVYTGKLIETVPAGAPPR